MAASPAPIQEWRDVTVDQFRDEILLGEQPVVLRGLVADWPIVKAAARSAEQASAYLLGFDRGAMAEAFVGPPEIDGRFFYAPDMRGFNFQRRKGPFADILRSVLNLESADRPPAIYAGAVDIPRSLPGFAQANPLPLVDGTNAVPRIWIGNRSSVSIHFDVSHNIAVVAAGRRRFTVFPPEQVANLYVGPLDHTMAGQPASMVSLNDPNLERYPRFAEALAHARSAELEPGDAIFIPALWWHQVDALSPFNILVNYWWDEAPREAGSPFEALIHGILAISHLPPARRAAWRAFYEQYVFREDDADPAAHLAPEHRGILAEPTPVLRQRIRQFLLRGLGARG